MKIKQGEDTKLRQGIEIAVKAALEEFAGTPLYQRVLSSNIMHTQLEPSGDAFQIVLRVEVHEKEKVQKVADTDNM